MQWQRIKPICTCIKSENKKVGAEILKANTPAYRIIVTKILLLPLSNAKSQTSVIITQTNHGTF
jgi:hypothetical protein